MWLAKRNTSSMNYLGLEIRPKVCQQTTTTLSCKKFFSFCLDTSVCSILASEMQYVVLMVETVFSFCSWSHGLSTG